MAISSFGPHRGETSWAATQTTKAKPRIVRLGRPANDNVRPAGVRAWMFVTAAGFTGAVLALIVANWRFF